MAAVVKRTDAFIGPSDCVTVTDMGLIAEVQYCQRVNRTPPIVKLSKTTYALRSTGEIKEFTSAENRGQSINSLRQTLRKLSHLVNNNFRGGKNELWVTLTYQENMQDVPRVGLDFNKFLKRLKYYCKKKFGKYKGHLEYLKVLEPQERGAWHIHMLVKFSNMDKVFIPNDDLAKTWSHGFVNVKNIKQTDNLGAYLCAYLADLPVDDGEWSAEEEQYYKDLKYARGSKGIEPTKSDEDKLVMKGGRLHLYPPGMNIFSKSKGIVYPEKQPMKYRAFQEKMGFKDENLTMRKAILVEDEATGFSNIIITEQYNKKVKNRSGIHARRNDLIKWLEEPGGDDKFRQWVKQELYKLMHQIELSGVPSA